jgi:hypothetical protein
MLQLLKDKDFKSLFKISHVGITVFKEKTPIPAGLNNLSDMELDYLRFQDRKGEEISKTKIGFN